MLPIQHSFHHPLDSLLYAEARKIKNCIFKLIWIQVSRFDLDLADHVHTQDTERQKRDGGHVANSFAISPGQGGY